MNILGIPPQEILPVSHTLPSAIARQNRRPVTLCGQDVPASSHICAFFDSRKEQDQVLLPFFREGVENREQGVSVFDAQANPHHLQHLAHGGLAHDDSGLARQLRVMNAEESFLAAGRFDADRMFGTINLILEAAAHTEFPHVRTCCEMTWALHHLEAMDPLIEYESRLNTLTGHHDCTLMCVYDVNLFSGPVLMDVLATHPYVLMGQTLTENPYYVPPREYLERVLRRRAAPAARKAALPA